MLDMRAMISTVVGVIMSSCNSSRLVFANIRKIENLNLKIKSHILCPQNKFIKLSGWHCLWSMIIVSDSYTTCTAFLNIWEPPIFTPWMLKRLVCQLTISIMIKCHFQDYYLYLLTLKTLCISIFTTAHISIQQMLLIFYAKDATVHSILDLRRNYLRYSYNLQLAIIGYISRAQGIKFYLLFFMLISDRWKNGWFWSTTVCRTDGKHSCSN